MTFLRATRSVANVTFRNLDGLPYIDKALPVGPVQRGVNHKDTDEGKQWVGGLVADSLGFLVSLGWLVMDAKARARRERKRLIADLEELRRLQVQPDDASGARAVELLASIEETVRRLSELIGQSRRAGAATPDRPSDQRGSLGRLSEWAFALRGLSIRLLDQPAHQPPLVASPVETPTSDKRPRGRPRSRPTR